MIPRTKTQKIKLYRSIQREVPYPKDRDGRIFVKKKMKNIFKNALKLPGTIDEVIVKVLQGKNEAQDLNQRLREKTPYITRRLLDMLTKNSKNIPEELLEKALDNLIPDFCIAIINAYIKGEDLEETINRVFDNISISHHEIDLGKRKDEDKPPTHNLNFN